MFELFILSKFSFFHSNGFKLIGHYSDLTHLFSVHLFFTPKKIRKHFGFPLFSEVRERVHREQMA